MFRTSKVIGVIAVVLVAAGGAATGWSQEAKHYRFAYDQPRNTGYSLAADIFADKLKEFSKGTMLIDQFPGAQLGQEPQVLQLMKAGDIEFCISAAANAATLSPQAGVMSLHFLFRSEDHLKKSLADPKVVQAIKDMIEQVRTLAFELRPSMLDEFGLVRALRLLVERHGKRSGISTSFTAAPTDVRAPREIETACFRIAQEALNNIASHARAHHVEVTLTGENNDLELMIGDDGVGFSIGQLRSSLGLVGMRERAELVGGRVDIESAPGTGTTLRARFPLSR